MTLENEPQPPKVPWGLVAVLGVLVAVFVPFAILQGADLAPFARQLVLIITAAFCALLLIAGTQAVASGTIFSIKFKILGSGAAFLIFYLLFLWGVPKADTSVVRLYLQLGEEPLLDDFSVNIRNPGMETIKKSGDEGEMSVELPSHLTVLDSISVTCVGYQLRDTRPFKIDNGVIRLAMVKGQKPSPMAPDQFPAPSAIPNLPTKSDVLKHFPAVTDPTAVTLEYKNVSEQNLRLLIFDCWRYYKGIEGDSSGVSPWMDFPFEARDEFLHFNGFRLGTGHFCFFARDAHGNNVFLGSRQLFETDTTRIVVTGRTPDLKVSFE